MPRSATTTHAKALALSHNVISTGEYHAPHRLCAEAIRVERAGGPPAPMTVTVGWLSDAGTLDREANEHTVILNKTPLSERAIGAYEGVFSDGSARYVYCLRNAYDVCRSISSYPGLAWRCDPVERNFKRYLASVRTWERQSVALGERGFVTVSDRLILERQSAVLHDVLRFLDIPSSNELLSAIDTLGPQNTTAQAGVRICPFSPREHAVIASNREYAAIEERYGLHRPTYHSAEYVR